MMQPMRQAWSGRKCSAHDWKAFHHPSTVWAKPFSLVFLLFSLIALFLIIIANETKKRASNESKRDCTKIDHQYKSSSSNHLNNMLIQTMFLVVLLFLSNAPTSSVNAFCLRESPLRRTSSSSLAFSIPSSIDFASISSVSSSSISISGDESLVESTIQAANQLMMEAKLFTGMAHVTLDLAAFVSRGTAWLRLGAVMGRLFVIGADYIPDHSVNTDEFLFQVFMMSISLIGLVHSVLPALLAMTIQTNKDTLIKDGRAFQVLFRNVGLTWFQYKSLVASQALEWVTVPPGQVITSEEDNHNDDGVYWLYKGQVQVESNGQHLHNVTRRLEPRLSDASLGLFGEARLVEDPHSFPPTTLTAGETGATLLRIRSEKLKSLMAHDVHIAESVRKLLFRSMQDKLQAALLLQV